MPVEPQEDRPRPPWIDEGEWPGAWRRRRWGRFAPRRHGRFLFLRFLLIFGVLAVLVVAGISVPAYLLVRLVVHFLAPGTAPAGWLAAAGGTATFAVALLLPLLAVRVARRAARGIVWPLDDLMAAADAVAAGDLSARVTASARGEFGRLAASFNHMAAELQRADQQRRNLTADVAHELRTPLHVIQGNLEGVLDGVYEPTPEHIQATLAETRALARLVDDLRTLSLAEAGQLPLAHERIDVAEFLADVATSFSGQAEAAGITLAVAADAAAGPLAVTGDEGRLDQVLGNLVINAIRHTPPGGRLTLAAAARPDGPGDPAAGFVRITVADTGEGIAAEDLPFIFDRFWRGDRSRTRPATRGFPAARGMPAGASGAEGSGLGLAIARQLVQAHGGRIAVESTPGQGTTFTIDLPVAAEQEAQM